MRRCILLAAAFCLAVGTVAAAGDWPAFRGPDGNGISTGKNVPQVWGPNQNVKWKAALPGPGDSSPIVLGKRVFVTCATDKGRNRSLFCFDRDTGKDLWVKTVEFSGDDPTHATNPYCGSTPATDGKRVVAFEGSAGVHCYDLDGNKLWSRDLGTFRHIWGYAASPVFHGDKVILHCGPGERTFITALNRETGETLWQTDEPGGASGEKGNSEWIGSWSTPQIVKVNGQDQILVSLPHHVNAYDPNDGKILWTCDGLGKLVYTSVVVGDGVAVAMGGFHGPAIGFKLGGSGDVTESNRLWRESTKIPQRIGSGIIIGKQLYMVNETGAMQCLEVETGKELWAERLTSNTWGSPVLAEGRMYVTNQQGTTVVFKPNPEKLEILGENKLNEQSNSTPALSDGQVFLRTFKHVYCIEEKAN